MDLFSTQVKAWRDTSSAGLDTAILNNWTTNFIELPIHIHINMYISVCVVGIATRYGLDVPGIESLYRQYFPRLSRQALGLTRPPLRWVLGLFRGSKAAGAWHYLFLHFIYALWSVFLVEDNKNLQEFVLNVEMHLQTFNWNIHLAVSWLDKVIKVNNPRGIDKC